MVLKKPVRGTVVKGSEIPYLYSLPNQIHRYSSEKYQAAFYLESVRFFTTSFIGVYRKRFEAIHWFKSKKNAFLAYSQLRGFAPFLLLFFRDNTKITPRAVHIPPKTFKKRQQNHTGFLRFSHTVIFSELSRYF